MSTHRPGEQTAGPAPAAAGTFTSTRAHGDFAVTATPPAGRAARRRSLLGMPCVEVLQVHGAGVLVVDDPGGDDLGGGVRDTEADALVTARSGVALAVRTADCAPVVLTGAGGGPVGVAHAGWRGVEAGVVEAAVAAMRALGAEGIEARIGPCIEGACYEFGAADLDRVADRYGSVVRCVTRLGTPGLSVVAAITVACERLGVGVVGPPPPCTACAADRYWSHRARAEPERMITAIWRRP